MGTTNPTSRLCVCLTPLHVLIAARLSQRTGTQFDLGIFMAYQQDDKHKHYFDTMSGFCKKTIFVTPPKEEYPRGLAKYLALYRRRKQHLKQFLALGQFSYALTSCSINHYLWCILQACKPVRLETYDDGLLNIASSPKAHYTPTPWREKIFLKLCGIKLHKDSLIELSARHYTIYNGKNLFPNTWHIDLHQPRSIPPGESGSNKTTEHIFLCPAPETPRQIWYLIERYLQKNPRMSYLPHPRGMGPVKTSSRVLETPLVIEDYVLSNLGKQGKHFVLVGTESSALINLAAVPGVQTFSILPKQPQHAQSRALLAQHGVKLVNHD